tara:strand:+ start:247 stop:372 length:126 start_codon:yes stop_codon:yes gene_type:complete
MTVFLGKLFAPGLIRDPKIHFLDEFYKSQIAAEKRREHWSQ